MLRNNPGKIIYIVKAIDLINLILSLAVIALAIFTIVNTSAHIYMISNIVLCAAVINILMSVKQFLQDEFQKSLALFVIGVILIIIGILQKIVV